MTDPHDAAIQEAYQRAGAQPDWLVSIELRHPAWVDGEGDPAPERYVHADGDDLGEADAQPIFGLDLPLEADAPANAGEAVRFMAGAWEGRVEGGGDQGTPRLVIAVLGASADIRRRIELAAGTTTPIAATLRHHLPGATAPSFVWDGLEVQEVTVGDVRVEAVLTAETSLERAWPPAIYRTADYPGLRGQ